MAVDPKNECVPGKLWITVWKIEDVNTGLPTAALHRAPAKPQRIGRRKKVFRVDWQMAVTMFQVARGHSCGVTVEVIVRLQTVIKHDVPEVIRLGLRLGRSSCCQRQRQDDCPLPHDQRPSLT